LAALDLESSKNVAQVTTYVADEADSILFTDPQHRPAMLQVSQSIGAIRSYVAERRLKLGPPSSFEAPWGPILALSATVPVQNQEDLVDALELEGPLIMRTTAVRPNIKFDVFPAARGYKAQAAELVALIDAAACARNARRRTPPLRSSSSRATRSPSQKHGRRRSQRRRASAS
jgi:hypothetical protein